MAKSNTSTPRKRAKVKDGRGNHAHDGHEVKQKQKHRELCSTTPLSWYWFLWRGRASQWQTFIDGSAYHSFNTARKAKGVEELTKGLKERPGIYEFSLGLPKSNKHFKVYVGKTNNMRRRHHEDYRGLGSHLLKHFEDCIQKGLVLRRRVFYTRNETRAKALESKLLKKYNYAWNHMENGKKRDVDLQANLCLCFQVSISVKSHDVKRKKDHF